MMVADFECILLKEEQIKGLNTKIIHKHQPCAWGLTVVTERKCAPYDQTFVKVAQSSVMCPLSSTAVHSGYSLRSLNASVAVLEREHGRVRCTRVVRLVLGLVSKY